MQENEIAEIVIGCAVEVHNALGPGLEESVYESCLHYELLEQKLFVERQKVIPLIYEEFTMDCGYRADLVVERKVIIEIKSVDAVNYMHMKEIVTYVKLLNCQLGLLINFNVVRLKDGIRRVAPKWQVQWGN